MKLKLHKLSIPCLIPAALLFFFLSCSINGVAQDSAEINSKKKELRVSGSDSVKVILLGDIAYDYAFINIDSSAIYAKKALELATQTQNKSSLAKAYSINGTVARLRGNLDESVSYFEKSYSIYKSLNDPVNMYKMLGNIGNAYNYIVNDYSKALKYYFRSLAIQKKIKHEKESAVTYLNISGAYLEQKNYIKSLHYLQKAESIAEKYNDLNTLGKACLNIGEFYSEIDQFEKSEHYFERSLQFRREIKDSMGVANTLNNLSALYETQKMYDKALEISLQALKIREYLSDSIGLATSYSNTSLIYLNMKKYNTALNYANKSLEINISIDFLPGIALSKRVIGEINRAMGNYQAAADNCKAGYEFWKANYDPVELNNACECLFQAYDKLNNDELAYKYFKESVFLNDSIQKEAKSGEAIRLRTKNEYEKKELRDSLSRALREERKNLERLKKEEADTQKIYLQQWIILFGSLFFMLIIISVVLVFRNNRAKQKALFQQKITETELMALRAQMNPHFIFNCLSSIQNCVDKNDFANADKYLGKFSKLLRTSLNSSRKAFISLEEEINYLQLYMELESMRMDHKFDFNFEVGPQINTQEVSIPVMILQPFIENSIKHGIASLKKKGLISVRFQKKNGQLEISIRDNGIGRENAAQINKVKRQNHESLGLEITRNRIKLLYPEIKNPIKINDLYEKDTATGTEVIIHLPLNTD